MYMNKITNTYLLAVNSSSTLAKTDLGPLWPLGLH